MTRKKSITDIGNLYASMYNNNIVEESNKEIVEEKAKKFPKDSFPQAGKEVKTSKAFNEAGPSKVKGIKKAKKNKKSSRKKVRESINSFMKSKFDKLFENVMDDEMDVNMDLGPGAGPEDAGASDIESEIDMDTEMGGDEVTITIDKATAQTLIDVLQAAVGGEEEMGGEEDSDLEDLEIDVEDSEGGESTEDEDEEEVDEDEDEEEEKAYEGIESEKLADSAGHKLTKDNKVPGTLSSASKGKASSDVTDEVGTSTLGDKGSHLSKPGNNVVGNLKKGGSLFSK
jgi:hypothetical protein